ncbi:MAG: type II toxin-antitoxin system VapC family toxin [bacterium]|nr:type II toxin-antitoxin system VapC family toxin [bacterium]
MALTLLDTDVLIRLRTDDPLLGVAAREVLAELFDSQLLAVSPASFNEVSRLVERGVIELTVPVLDWCRRCLDGGIRLMPLSVEIVAAAPWLKRRGFQGDPFDQLIVATAVNQGCGLATTDRSIISWADQSGELTVLNARA